MTISRIIAANASINDQVQISTNISEGVAASNAAMPKTISVAAVMSNDVQSAMGISKNINASSNVTTEIRHNTVSDYDLLSNKPQINSVTLQGNKMLPEIGVDSISNMELEHLLT